MLIGMIDIAHNCPKHDFHSFWKLEWFDSISSVIEWARCHTKKCWFISELWDSYTREKSDFSVQYEYSQHACIGVKVIDKTGSEMVYIKQNPYDNNKEWIVEKKEGFELEEVVESENMVLRKLCCDMLEGLDDYWITTAQGQSLLKLARLLGIKGDRKIEP